MGIIEFIRKIFQKKEQKSLPKVNEVPKIFNDLQEIGRNLGKSINIENITLINNEKQFPKFQTQFSDKQIIEITKNFYESLGIKENINIEINIKNGKILDFDLKIYQFFKSNIINDKLTPIVKVITHIGGAKIVIALSILAIILIKGVKNKLFILTGVVGTAGLNVILKHIIQRERPNINRLIPEKGYSFPSGHAMMSMAFYGMLIFLIFKYVNCNIYIVCNLRLHIQI